MLDTVKLIGKLHASNPWVNLGMNESRFLAELGLTRDCYCSRVRTARALHSFPEVEEAFLKGELSLSTIGRIQAKLTRANIAIVLANICGKTKRDTILFMSKVTNDGRIRDISGTVELTITVSEEELAAFFRLRDVLSARGDNPSTSDVLKQAVEDSLEKRGPMRKAERAEVRQRKKVSKPALVVPGQQGSQPQQMSTLAMRRVVATRFLISSKFAKRAYQQGYVLPRGNKGIKPGKRPSPQRCVTRCGCVMAVDAHTSL